MDSVARRSPLILVLEDEALTAMDLQMLLASEGYRVAGPVASCEAALEAVAAEIPSLLLADVRVDGPRDGIDIAAELKAKHDVPTIFLTSELDTATAKRAVATGPLGFLTKPLRRAELLATIETALARSALERELREREAQRAGNEAKVLEAQKLEAIGRLAGGIAHDFNNLLTVILGITGSLGELLREGDGAARDMVRDIDHAGRRAAELTRQLLTFAHGHSASRRLVDLNQSIASFDRLLSHAIGDRVRLELDLESGLWPINLEASGVEQIVLNLAVNARDAMPRGGTFTIRARNELSGGAPRVVLEVSDTGTGMDELTRARLFEPFFTTKPAGKGTGLGLASVYGIVTQAGGTIAVKSAPGAGTTFTLSFPRVADAVAGWPTPPPRTPGGRERVLVVEDEPIVRDVTARILKSGGYSVVAVDSSAAAFDVVETSEVDLLVTDVAMPELDGAALAAEVRRRRPGMKVLFVSGYPREAEHVGELDEFLPKPYTRDVLLAKVREVLERAEPA